MRAHRISMLIEHGYIPDGKQVNHRCNNPGGVRPSHLYFGTQTDNMSDMVKAGNSKVHLNGVATRFRKGREAFIRRTAS